MRKILYLTRILISDPIRKKIVLCWNKKIHQHAPIDKKQHNVFQVVGDTLFSPNKVSFSSLIERVAVFQPLHPRSSIPLTYRCCFLIEKKLVCTFPFTVASADSNQRAAWMPFEKQVGFVGYLCRRRSQGRPGRNIRIRGRKSNFQRC